MLTGWEDQSESPRRLLFRAHLKPHRSLSQRDFRRMMLAVTAFSLTVSTIAFLHGAWPVFGFMGLDIALGLFRLPRQLCPRPRVGGFGVGRAHAIRRTHGPEGRRRAWQLQPAWLKVELHEPILPQTPVMLRTHGKSLPVGVFLHPDQRREVARDLRGGAGPMAAAYVRVGKA